MYGRSISGSDHHDPVAAVQHRGRITRRSLVDAGEDDDVIVAGQRVSAGRYRRVDVAEGRVVEVAEGDYLPASLDGRVAIYEKLRDAEAVARK